MNENLKSIQSLTSSEPSSIPQASPEELALDTLKTLPTFLDQLIQLCQDLAADQVPDSENSIQKFAALTDGIQTLVEGIECSRSVLNKPKTNPMRILEAELKSILQDFVETEDDTYRNELLKTHLVQNLIDWKNEAIPYLLNSD